MSTEPQNIKTDDKENENENENENEQNSTNEQKVINDINFT